jgi:methylmalonyl-CoA mutase N-terminal domain/subunit
MALKDEKKRWEDEILDPALKRFPERKSEFSTLSGIPVPRLLTPSDPDPDYEEKLGFPGEFPFTRGVQPSMYRGRFWTMRQYAGYASAEESNRRYRYLLEQGQTGLSVAFDLPTQIGYDADDPISLGEVGKVGVAVSSLEDMSTLFNQIPLDKVSTSMTINAPASILLAMYIAVAKRQGVEPQQLRGTIQNDILKEYIARGTYIFPPDPSMRLVTTLANGIAYVQAAIEAGLDVDSFATQLSFFFNAHNNFLEEVAKFRAARRMWANIMRHRFNAQDPRSWKLRFHTQTAGSTLTAQQPENNIVRVTLQALAAIFGGTQSLHTNSMDEALWLPTEKAVRIALRTQQIIAHESGVADSADPMGGSYLVEYLTDEIEEAAKTYIQRIDDMGGALAAIDNGYIQDEIQKDAYNYQRAVERGEQVVVGLNAFQVDTNIELERLQVDPAIEEAQCKRLVSLRARRDRQRVSDLLSQLENTARSSDNLMPLLIECAENDITLGEICSLLRRQWGEYQPPAWI